MTEKDITLGESDGGGGGVSSISMCGGNLEANGGKIKSQRVHVKTNVSSKEADEEGFLSTSPDSANGDQMVLVGGHQINTNADHQQPTTKTTTTLAPTNGNSGELNADTHKATVPVLYTACPATHCVTLKNILDSFKAPLSEEQAWALIYQFVSLYRKVSDARARYVFTAREVPKTMENLNLHRDGSVHFSCYKKLNERRVTSRQAAEGKALDDAEAAHLEQRQRNQHTTSNAVIGRAFDKHASTPTPLPAVSHRKIIRELAILVYTALDYNLQADEQYQMSQELEELITYMTADESDDDCIDEGIDEGDKRWDDENDDEKCNETKELDFILEACRNHVKPTVPEDHYKAVCRALVTETLELRIFLQQVLNDGAEKLHLAADSQTSQKELAKLGFNDWARFWVQVIDELRRGVRLKKSNFERAPIEYELTPYEILMEDIRSKKYQLRKVMVNGDIPPRVKKDAHALILEFIRSRPPLKKASERKLPPPLKRTPSPREQLMDSIRQGRTLKHITPPALPRLKDRLLPPTNQMTSSASAALPTTTGTGGVTELPRSNQRLIKVDFSLLQDDDTFFDGSRTSHAHGSHTAHIGVCSQPKMPPYPIGGYMVKENAATGQAPLLRNTRRTKEPFTKDEYHRFFDNALESYDLATQCESRRASLRRHTIVGCQSNFDETHSMPPSRPDSRQSQASDVNATATATGSAASTTKEQHNNYNQEQQQRLKRTKSPAPSCGGNSTGGIAAGAEETHCSSRSASSLGPWNKSFLDKKTWMERGDDRLSLTLEEIVHIRSVMTKAELEGLPVGVRVKEDVEKRKVCFLCLRTRFSIFGPWGIQCKLCQRTVCSKCYTKMRIPAEHSRNVPLVLISPSLLSSPASSSTPSPSHQAQHSYSSSTGNMDDAFPKTLIERLLRSESERKTRNSVGSAPSSPKHQRSNMSTPGLQATTSKEAAVNAAAAAGQAVEALHDDAMSSSYTAAVKPSPQLAAAKQNYNVMSRSMEGPRSLPVHSPARPLSSSSTLDRKSRFSRGFTLSASGSQLTQDQKENMRGEQVSVCNDCQGLVNEITSSAKQKRSSARNRTLQKLTLDLSPVWK